MRLVPLQQHSSLHHFYAPVDRSACARCRLRILHQFCKEEPSTYQSLYLFVLLFAVLNGSIGDRNVECHLQNCYIYEKAVAIYTRVFRIADNFEICANISHINRKREGGGGGGRRGIIFPVIKNSSKWTVHIKEENSTVHYK